MTSEISQARAAAIPLEQAADLDPLIDRIGDARFVLIGEASHGTHEYYDWRATLSRRLIAEHGFSAVVVEADQADCTAIDRSVRLVDETPDSPEDLLRAQRHWPSWMQANAETADFCTWLQDHNRVQRPLSRTGWHGLDAYPLWAATRGVVWYLSRELGWPADRVNDALDAPMRGEPMVPPKLIDQVTGYLARLALDYPLQDSAWTYYRRFLQGGDQSMNARAKHGLGRIGLLSEQYGEESRMIIWAHNTHVGDARGTNGSAASIGQLVRERYGSNNAFLVGFAGGEGSVMAVRERGAAMGVIDVPAPRPGSVEALLSEAADDAEQALFVFPKQRDIGWLAAPRGHRAIGVVYNPDREIYVPTQLGRRYDALIWYRNITPVQAFHLPEARQGTLETLRIADSRPTPR